MNVIIVVAVTVMLGVGTEGQFDPQLRVLGNIVMSIGNHLFARFTYHEVPAGSENGTFIEQVSYIHQMLQKMRDHFLNPPEGLEDQLRDLTQSFSFQVKVQLPKLDIEEKDLKDKFGLTEEEIKRFQLMANDCKRFVDEIIDTRGVVTDKYL
ncbi:hypothetical protein J6590_026054 [Homalodisca vitripennis]|nr:hypothetical protein J6590_026054 [Homalodisca vitripennis]